MKGGETRETHRIERSSTARSGEPPEHIVAADQMRNSVVSNQSSRGSAVELRHTYNMCTAGDRGHCRSVTESSAEWHGAMEVAKPQPTDRSYFAAFSLLYLVRCAAPGLPMQRQWVLPWSCVNLARTSALRTLPTLDRGK